MSKTQTFLITYGLHNFVSCTDIAGKPVFSIKKQQGDKMIGHAKALIMGAFGPMAAITLA